MFALYVAATVVFSDMYLTQPILPLLAEEFQVTASTAGLTISAVVVMIALGSTAYGPLSDMIGRKSVMVAACALLSLPTMLGAFATSFEQMLFFRALQGLCIPGLTAVAVAYLGDLVGPTALGKVVGGWVAANVAGGLVGRVASGIITDLAGWREVFVIFALLTMVSALLLAFLLPEDRVRESGGWGQAYRAMFAHINNPQLFSAFMIGGALFFGFIGTFTFLPFYLTNEPFLLSTTMVAFAYVSYLAGVLVSPIAGSLSNRISRRTLITLGLLIAMLGLSLTLIPVLPLIAISLFILCTGMFTAQAIAPALVNTLAKQAKGGAGALYLVFYYIGGTLGAVVPGLAWQAFGWIGVVATCLTAFGIALIANWRIKL
ncbi:MAG: MFS transporter [Chloroflexia bacterium]|nr:MFS transporter [Chloroflexia bacterium]